MGLVDDDETEVLDRCKKSGTGADDDLGGCGFGDFDPVVSPSFGGLVGVENGDYRAEVLNKYFIQLGSKSDLW